jgi:hypothetical protein
MIPRRRKAINAVFCANLTQNRHVFIARMGRGLKSVSDFREFEYGQEFTLGVILL